MPARRLIEAGALTVGTLLAVAAPALSQSTGSLPRCETRQLRLVASFYGEALGSFTQTFTFRNASRQACRLRGWPSLELKSQLVASRRVRQSAPPSPAFATVVLDAGSAASFDVYGADWDHALNRACAETTAVLITPPGDLSALSVAVRMPSCGLFYIAPLIAGRTDRQSWSVVVHG